MITTVTNNDPKSINTSLFDLEKQIEVEIKSLRQQVQSLNKQLEGINTSGTVLSVNGKQGIVQLSASDVGALSNDTFIPNNTNQLTNGAGFITQADVSNIYVPKTRKINNKELSEDITLTAEDVNALPDTYEAPVTSVNGETGEVEITNVETANNLVAGGTAGQVLTSNGENPPTWEDATGGGSNQRDILLSDYEALSDAEKDSDTTWFVPDSEGVDLNVIDDENVSEETTWSSSKINGALTNYQPKEWKIAGTATGTNPINLPSDFIELNVNVYIETANRVFKFHFIKEELGVNNLLCTIGWGYSSYNNYCEMKLNLNPRRLSLNGLAFDSTDYTSRAYVSIYYR